MSTITEDGVEFEFPALKECQETIDAKQKSLAEMLDKAGPELKMTAEQVDAVRALNDELTDLGKERDNLKTIAKGLRLRRDHDAEAGDETGAPSSGVKTLGEMIGASGALKGRGNEKHVDVDLKTLFQRSAGWTPESTRSGLVVLSAQRPVQVTQLLPQIPTKQAAYKYMEETTFTNNAAEKAEGNTYGEAAFVLTERSVTIEKLTVWVPVTDEQLEDEEGAMAYLDLRLPFMIEQRLDSQILVGDGSTPNILGINNKGSVGTQAKGADPVPDAIYKGATKCRVTGRAMPDAVVFHPNDWQDVRLLRTADGIYIWGNPSEAGPERIWGLQVVQSDAQTENTAVVGDFGGYSILVMNRGINVQVSNSHSTYFVEGKQAVRADMRCATVWTRAAAFTLVSGI